MRRPALCLVVTILLIAPLRAQDRGLDIRPMLDAYFTGDYDKAVAQAAALTDLGPFRLRFVQDTPAWIGADPEHAERRANAVAAFLLEVTAARLESDWGRFADLIEWTCVQLRTRPPSEFERSWHAASHALAGRARARLWLLGEYARLPHQKPSTAKPSDPEHPPAQHLMHALERFPDDPNFQLSRVVAWTWGRDSEPMRNLRARDDPRPNRNITRRPAQLEGLVTLGPLEKIDAVAAEAFVRDGLIRVTAGDYAGALTSFESAQAVATETSMKYLAHFEAGRALEALSRPDDAMRAYQRALEIIPTAESATIALTSLQFSHDDREPAIAQLDRVFNHTPGDSDPGRLTGYGSFLRWASLKAAMRKALQ